MWWYTKLKKKYIERLWIVICFQNTTFKCISLLCKKCNYTLFKSWNSREIYYKNEQKDSLWVIIIIISHRWHRNHFTRWKKWINKTSTFIGKKVEITFFWILETLNGDTVTSYISFTRVISLVSGSLYLNGFRDEAKDHNSLSHS